MKLHKIFSGFIFILLSGSFFFYSCSYEPEIEEKPVQLTFSTDTIQFDTIFVERKSITKRLLIKNPSNNAISIDQIGLTNPQDHFQLVVNGVEGTSFANQLLLGNDSLLVLVEAFIDQSNENNPFVIRDALQFINKGNEQQVVLEAWGQNANYLRDSVLVCDSRWTAKKPYIIANNILIDSSCSLTIEPGTKIYSSNNSFILVAGTLKAEGTVENPVIFMNDRLDEPFASAPGQWGGIVFLEGSTNNYFRHTEIKNGVVGLNLNIFNRDGTADVVVENSLIGNMTFSAVLSLNSEFAATNSVFYNTAFGTISHVGGGLANYHHCTIANYLNVAREQPAAFFSDFAVDNDENQIINPLEVILLNSIIYGRNSEEIFFDERVANNLTISFSHDLFRSTNPQLNTNSSILNENPLFKEPANSDFSLTKTSPAIGKALPGAILIDIRGQVRDMSPDIGAYEFVPKEEE